MKPSVGRVVHAVLTNGVHQAALISKVHGPTCVDVHVMQTDHLHPVVLVTSLMFDETAPPNSWHWPERD